MCFSDSGRSAKKAVLLSPASLSSPKNQNKYTIICLAFLRKTEFSQPTGRLFLYFREMNFLAHIYLSGEDEFIQIGNFIADGIKGNKYLKFPEEIQKGILLHREIDSFTDHHPTVRQSTKRLHPNYSHYSGVIVDMYYDHFLAKNWKRYSDTPLEAFADNFYSMLNRHYHVLPERTRKMMPYMLRDNWLVSYASLEGIHTALTQLNRRTDYKANMNLAINDLEKHYELFENEFTAFFEELIIFTRAKLPDKAIKTDTEKRDKGKQSE